jgi:hypothetical protein
MLSTDYRGGGKLQRSLAAPTAVVVFAVLLTESEIVIKPSVMSAVLYVLIECLEPDNFPSRSRQGGKSATIFMR